jgi:phosphoesterase RecJ-like protein
MSIRKVIDCINQYNHFLVTSHINLEGDALGSELAFAELILSCGKKVTVVNESQIPSPYNFLNQIKKIKKVKQIKGGTFDVLAALDCSDSSRCKEVIKNTSARVILNIDHHISNTRFGDINWVQPQASSTAEMVFKLYKKMGIALNRQKALLLYIGLLSDTGSFHYPNTSIYAHKMAASLLKHNLQPSKIYRDIYQQISYSDMRLLTQTLATMKSTAGGKVIYFSIPARMLRGKKISFDLTEYILMFGRLLKEAKVVMLFKENLGEVPQVRVNFRSRGEADVNKIAALFGGGGHKNASGCTIAGSLKTVRSKVLRETVKLLNCTLICANRKQTKLRSANLTNERGSFVKLAKITP